MLIGPFDLSNRAMLIAEIGNNHEGDPALAAELADAAIESGADAIKFQILDPVRLVNRSETARIEQLTRYRLAPDVLDRIAEKVRSQGRLFMASVFDCATLSAVGGGLDAIKIASGDLDFDPLLEVAAGTGKPIILSTGMATEVEIQRSVGVIALALPAGITLADQLAVLHCVSLYPTPPERANLAAISRLKAILPLTIGYSDHTLGLDAAMAAVALGARIVEKHFTLDKTRASFRDHALSAEPAEFAQLARFMHSFDAMMGDGRRDAVVWDAATRAVARRSAVAARDLAAGVELVAGDLDYVRPAGGTSPADARNLIGRTLKSAVTAHQRLTSEDVV